MAKKKTTDETEDSSGIDIEKIITKKYGSDIINPGTFVIENPQKILHISPIFDQV